MNTISLAQQKLVALASVDQHSNIDLQRAKNILQGFSRVEPIDPGTLPNDLLQYVTGKGRMKTSAHGNILTEILMEDGSIVLFGLYPQNNGRPERTEIKSKLTHVVAVGVDRYTGFFLKDDGTLVVSDFSGENPIWPDANPDD